MSEIKMDITNLSIQYYHHDLSKNVQELFVYNVKTVVHADIATKN